MIGNLEQSLVSRFSITIARQAILIKESKRKTAPTHVLGSHLVHLVGMNYQIYGKPPSSRILASSEARHKDRLEAEMRQAK